MLKPSHTTTETVKIAVTIVQTCYNFFHNWDDFLNSFMNNNLHNNIEKTLAVPVVQCKGLSYTLQFSSQPPTIISTVLYMENNFHNDFYLKNRCNQSCSKYGPYYSSYLWGRRLSAILLHVTSLAEPHTEHGTLHQLTYIHTCTFLIPIRNESFMCKL